MTTNTDNLVTLNVFGPSIRLEDVDRVLNPDPVCDQPESNHVAYFFKLPIDKLTKEILIRYAKACDVMCHVGVGTHNQDIKEKLIDTIASAKRCFSYGEFLACIELCAINGEMLSSFLCIVNQKILEAHASVTYEAEFYERMYQSERLNLLTAANIITEEARKKLYNVHQTRKRFYHRWGAAHTNIESEALESLRDTTDVAAKYLELLYNTGNLDLIRIYMQKNAGALNMHENVIQTLNDLSSEINQLYGYVNIPGDNYGEPAINSGPCASFAKTFCDCWNARFKEKVHIAFIMVKNSNECWHVLVRLPDGNLFDGGHGVYSEDKYLDKFDIEDMVNFEPELLNERAYGLDRSDPRYCPSFSVDAIKKIIENKLNTISEEV